jgi:hypothetical protein
MKWFRPTLLMKWFRPTEEYYRDLLRKTSDEELRKAILDTITDIQIYKYS